MNSVRGHGPGGSGLGQGKLVGPDDRGDTLAGCIKYGGNSGLAEEPLAFQLVFFLMVFASVH